ncbi:flavodoxin [Periweissella cryptocerci]|uniref:Flavodoxin n=1 Tax=Periweissella cryptocerci TaxID=2506420 RepID=A0A4P6YRL2_9LACO|nr:flavodoxin [Periweissella cryptocerci]QBO35299.1 flavodoxin [Periweissella cryptocerci]
MKAKVIFATITGNNEDVADIIVEGFEDHDVEVDKEEISISEVDELSDYDIVVLVPYTYDKGSLPEEGMDFFDDLETADLSGVVYGVAGSGDTYYGDDFGVAVDKFDATLAKTKATKGAENVKINLSPNAKDVEKLDAFVMALLAKVNG